MKQNLSKISELLTHKFNGNIVEPGEAIEAQDIINGGYMYAEDAGGDDTYAISLPVAPSSLTDGLTVRVKFATANTGAATLNVNGLGADAILRPDGSALQTGDILANQKLQLQYDDGDWYMMSPLGIIKTFKVINTSRAFDAASGDQVIAHGLGGRVPTKVKISAVVLATDSVDTFSRSSGAYDGATQGCVWNTESNDTGTKVALVGQETTKIVKLVEYAGDHQAASIAVDATNITLTWTKTGSPTANTMYLLIECEG